METPCVNICVLDDAAGICIGCGRSGDEIARRVQMSPVERRTVMDTLPERLKRLERAGLIAGYRADIALAKLGPHVAVFVLAELEAHRAESFQTFERAVAARDEITACWAIGGCFDYLLQVVTRDIDSYQRLIDDLLESGAGLKRYFTYIVTKAVKGPAAPPLDILLDSARQE